MLLVYKSEVRGLGVGSQLHGHVSMKQSLGEFFHGYTFKAFYLYFAKCHCPHKNTVNNIFINFFKMQNNS